MKRITIALALAFAASISIVPLEALANDGAPSYDSIDQALLEYKLRQEWLRCAAHPDEYCLTQPVSENDKARREYQARQARIRCANYPEQCPTTPCG